jgi:hypothetical protein
LDEGHDGYEYHHQGDRAQAKLKDQTQHPGKHEKHEKRPKHQRTSLMPVGHYPSMAARKSVTFRGGKR